jgi:hypothetical protein
MRLYPKFKAGTILCPHPKCLITISDVAPESIGIIDTLTEHMRLAHKIEVTKEKQQELTEKIDYLRSNTKIPYTDPFLYVSYEELSKKK